MSNTSPEQEPSIYEACQQIVRLRKQIAALTAENKRLRDRLKSHGDIETDKEEITQTAIKEGE